MKRCNKCNTEKEPTEFHKHSSSADGKGYMCKICHNASHREWRKANPGKARESGKRRYLLNPDKQKELSRKHYRLNSTLHNEQRKNRVKQNPEKYKRIHGKANAKWKKENPGKWNAIAAKYRASKYKATPKWLTDSHWEEIEELYMLAQELAWLNNGEVFAVDHIVPLQGKNVSGLHVPWNLQLLPKVLNSSKGNRVTNV